MTPDDRRRYPCVIVRRSLVHGLGVFARHALHAGEILVEYKGERVDQEVAFSRPPCDPDHPDRLFLLGLDDGSLIDGARKGNTARWINHSCEPNCVAENRKGRIFIRALRAIRAGRQITIDYAPGVDGAITSSMRERFVCRCGSRSCRGTMLVVRRSGTPGKIFSDPDGTVESPPSEPQPAAPAQIKVLERLARNRIAVSWRQPGRACYSEQVWSRGTAGSPGRCALSNVPFEAGADVFAPTGVPRPLNREERILVMAIKAIDGGSAA